MTYKLEKPYTEDDRINFIVNYNHRQGLVIKETENALYALLPNEIMQDGIPVVNPNYEHEMARQRQQEFEKEFFETSLGWIRRKVRMHDGSTKDFLSDLLMPIKAGLESGVEVQIITYLLPDFSDDITNEYLITLQQQKNANLEFVRECLNQTVKDFCGG